MIVESCLPTKYGMTTLRVSMKISVISKMLYTPDISHEMSMFGLSISHL